MTHLGLVGPRSAPCRPREPCYLGYDVTVKTVVNAALHSSMQFTWGGLWGGVGGGGGGGGGGGQILIFMRRNG